MNMPLDSRENHPGPTDSKTRPPRPKSLSNTVAAIVILAYAAATLAMFVPLLGWCLAIVVHCSFLVVLYVGIPAATLAWVVGMLVRVFLRRRRDRLVWTALKYAIISFGGMGILIGVATPMAPGYRMHLLGYSLHMKAWVNTEEVRRWAQSRPPATQPREGVPAEEWPASLRNVPYCMGYVTVNPTTRAVRFDEGGGFGHWGLVVAPRGTPTPKGDIELEDGVWVYDRE